MNCHSPHVPTILLKERPSNGSVHCAGVIPDNEVAWIFPFNLNDILLLSRMGVEMVDKLLRSFLVQILDVVDMSCNVKIHPIGFIVALYEVVSSHRIFCWIHVSKELGRSKLSRMMHRMGGDIVVIKKLSFEIFI